MFGGGAIPGGNIEVNISAKYDDKGLSRLDTDLEKAERAAKGLDGEMKDVDRSMGKATKSADQLGRSSSKTGGKLKSGLKAGAAGAAVAIGVGLVAAFKKSYTEAREAQKVNAQTEAVLKSTGKAANVTASQVANLATNISNKTAIDDEAIQSGSNLLLTFKDIKNEAGKGNDIFNQTTRAMIDMSVAMKQDTKSSAIQLGKALNDPIKGLSALSRVGIQFTEDQKKMIEGLVNSGNKMAAQKIILKELNSQFGGSAAAAANPVERLRVVMNNMAEDLGTMLLPYIDKAADAIIKFVEEFKKGTGTGGDFKKFIQDLGQTMKNLWPIVKAVGGAVYSVVKAFAGLPKEAQIAIVSLVGLSVAALKVYQLVKVIQASTMAMKIFAGVARMLPLAMGPVGLAFMALVAVGYVVYKNWDTIKEQMLITWDLLKIGAKKLADVVVKAAKYGFLGPIPFIISNWEKVVNFFKALPGKIWNAIKGIGSTIASPFIWVYKKVSWAVNKTAEAVEKAVDRIKDAGGAIGDGVSGAFGFVTSGAGLFAEGGKVGPGAGGPKMFVAGEGNKPEWVVSTEGNRKKNQGYVLEAASALGMPMYAKGGRVKGAETRLARAELTKPLGDDIRAATELRNIYSGSVRSLDKKLRKNRNGRDWFDRKFNKKKARAMRQAAIDERLSDLGSLKQYRDQVISLRGESMGDGSSLAEQINSFNSERFELLSSFAGNIRNRAGAVAGAVPSGPSGSIPTPVNRGSEGTTVKITQNYTEPPRDPHSWTRNIQNEVAALV